MLASELAELVEQLSRMGRGVVTLLRPGAQAAEVEAAFGRPVPDSVADWFSWCNGVTARAGQIQDDVNIIPGYNLVSVNEAVAMIPTYSGDDVLGFNWIPLLRSGGGDIYAAVWDSARVARVAGVIVGEPTEIEFSSIEQMVSVFNECFRNGAFYIDPQGMFSMDPELYDETYARILGV